LEVMMMMGAEGVEGEGVGLFVVLERRLARRLVRVLLGRWGTRVAVGVLVAVGEEGMGVVVGVEGVVVSCGVLVFERDGGGGYDEG